MPTDSSEIPLCLLLLQPPSYPPTSEALKATYFDTIFTVLTDLFPKDGQSSKPCARLDIALPCDHLYRSVGQATPRAKLFQETQRLVTGIYKLITLVCAKAGIPDENNGGIDARVILLEYSSKKSPQIRQDNLREGPVISLATLGASNRAWRSIFVVDSELGQQVADEFRSLISEPFTFKVVPGSAFESSVDAQASSMGSEALHGAERHASVAVGGTFDHLHAGHKLLLTMTAFMVDTMPETHSVQTRHLTIGITGDEMLKNKKFAEHLQSWTERMEGADRFLRSILLFSSERENGVTTKESREPGPNGHVVRTNLSSGLVIDYVEILDPYGPTITDEAISALVISAETRSGGGAVNVKRQERGWSSLQVFEVDVLDADDAIEDADAQKGKVEQTFQNKLSSTEIRRCMSENREAAGRA